MPGRLIMERNGADGAKIVVNGKQPSAGAVQSATSGSPGSISHPQKRVESNVLANGDTPIPGIGAYPTPNGVSPTTPVHAIMPESMQDLPEEIIHITQDFHSLGLLIERVNQECFNSLNDVVDQLSKIQVQTAPLANGVGNHAPPNPLGDTSPENKYKKELMLQFASDFRAKFIKLLVISLWSQNANEASKLIDLKNWLYQQIGHAWAAGDGLGVLMQSLRSFKLPSPDMQTALAVLSKGEVPWMPDMRMLPSKRLSAPETLRTLRQMGSMLNIRLILHEDLIPQLRNYKIANGRATFTFPDEFELDVYVSSDDPAKPFFFLDVRFLFDPAPQISSDYLRGEMDKQINLILAGHGLRGAYDFIHGFVLTHKIGILGRQASELSRSIWASALRIEQVHRMLVVQYWIESPQAKSWIEIGITSGRRKGAGGKSDNAITSMIKARWTRNGNEEKDVEVLLDLKELSAERILKAYIARHSSLILGSIAERLGLAAEKQSKGEVKFLTTELRTSENEPADCNLTTQIGEHPPVTIGIDSITGRLFLEPASPSSNKAQQELERFKDPAADAHNLLSRYLPYDIQQRIEKLAEVVGWTIARNINLKFEEVKAWTKRDSPRYGFFQPRGWTASNWYIAYTINLCGECWWTMEINSSSTGHELTACRQLPTTIDNKQPPLSQKLFKKIEQFAARTSTYNLADKKLIASKVNSSLRYLPVKVRDLDDDDITIRAVQDPDSGLEKTLPTLMLRYSHLLRKSKTDNHFAGELLQLCYLGFETDLGQVKLVAKGVMKNPSKIQDILERTRDDNVAFDVDGSFSVVVRTKLGNSCIDQVVARLSTIGTLCNFAKVLKQRGLECKDISFTRIVFKYAKDLEVELRFTGTDENSAIRVHFAPLNPHRRIAVELEQMLNKPEEGFEKFTRALSVFLPILRAFDSIDQRHLLDYPASPTILLRHVDFYRITYPNPQTPQLPHCVFDLTFKRNRDELEWRIADVTSEPAKEERDKLFPGFNAKLLEFLKSVGRDWTGMRTILTATESGVEEAVTRLDEFVSRELISGSSVQTGPKNAMARNETGPEIIMLD